MFKQQKDPIMPLCDWVELSYTRTEFPGQVLERWYTMVKWEKAFRFDKYTLKPFGKYDSYIQQLQINKGME